MPLANHPPKTKHLLCVSIRAKGISRQHRTRPCGSQVKPLTDVPRHGSKQRLFARGCLVMVDFSQRFPRHDQLCPEQPNNHFQAEVSPTNPRAMSIFSGPTGLDHLTCWRKAVSAHKLAETQSHGFRTPAKQDPFHPAEPWVVCFWRSIFQVRFEKSSKQAY